jgi:hypothetical protein
MKGAFDIDQLVDIQPEKYFWKIEKNSPQKIDTTADLTRKNTKVVWIA